MSDAINTFLSKTGIAAFMGIGEFGLEAGLWIKYLIMYVIIGVLFYLAVVKKFEPLLLLPIAFGMLLANLPAANLMHMEYFFDEFYLAQGSGTLSYQVEEFVALLSKEGFALTTQEVADGMFKGETLYNFKACFSEFLNSNGVLPDDVISTIKNCLEESGLAQSVSLKDNGAVAVKMSAMIKHVVNYGGLVDILYLGVKLGIYPSLIFLGVGAMTDFAPLISNPKSLLMGAGAQFGVFAAFFFALCSGFFSPMEAASIGIIGGAEGPTAILVTKTLAPQLLGAIAIAAYSYMALIPIIQPPFMRLLTTEKERKIRMSALRPVSKVEKVVFPIIVAFLVCLIIPDAAPLVGFLMLGNLFNVSGVTDRLSKTTQNELINIVTIFLGVSVGATANAENFLDTKTLLIIALGLVAFIISTCGGLITGKIMCKLTGGKINPLIGSAGVSAVPMAARVAQDEGRKADPGNFLLMHAMGPNVAGVIGSAVAAGVFLSFFA